MRGALVAFLLISYVGNLASPPPPSVPAIYTLGLAGGAALLVWAWWLERHRLLEFLEIEGHREQRA